MKNNKFTMLSMAALFATGTSALANDSINIDSTAEITIRNKTFTISKDSVDKYKAVDDNILNTPEIKERIKAKYPDNSLFSPALLRQLEGKYEKNQRLLRDNAVASLHADLANEENNIAHAKEKDKIAGEAKLEAKKIKEQAQRDAQQMADNAKKKEEEKSKAEIKRINDQLDLIKKKYDQSKKELEELLEQQEATGDTFANEVLKLRNTISALSAERNSVEKELLSHKTGADSFRSLHVDSSSSEKDGDTTTATTGNNTDVAVTLNNNEEFKNTPSNHTATTSEFERLPSVGTGLKKKK